MADRIRDFLKTFDRNASDAFETYEHCNRNAPDREANFCPELIKLAVELGYLRWPRKIMTHVEGCRVLDIGCGRTLHGIGFLVVGARQYVGVDPKIRMDWDGLRNRSPGLANSKTRESHGWTPRQIMDRMPRITYLDNICREDTFSQKFDVVLLHNVTEHAADLQDLFQMTAGFLEPGGKAIFNHHNFFSWNGHHMRPRDVKSIDLADTVHQKVIDWGHLDLMKAGDPIVVNPRINRVSLQDLQRYTDAYFEVEDWKEQRSNESQGGERDIAEVLLRHLEITERDLRVQNVFAVLRKR